MEVDAGIVFVIVMSLLAFCRTIELALLCLCWLRAGKNANERQIACLSRENFGESL
jgi:hypothetical protein